VSAADVDPIAVNPASGAKVPRIRQRQKQLLTGKQVEFLAAPSTSGTPRSSASSRMAVCGEGMRPQYAGVAST